MALRLLGASTGWSAVSQLELLHLSGNGLNGVPWQFLNTTPKLQRLHLRFNQIDRFPSFPALRSL
jgi:hypothetical protein